MGSIPIWENMEKLIMPNIKELILWRCYNITLYILHGFMCHYIYLGMLQCSSLYFTGFYMLLHLFGYVTMFLSIFCRFLCVNTFIWICCNVPLYILQVFMCSYIYLAMLQSYSLYFTGFYVLLHIIMCQYAL